MNISCGTDIIEISRIEAAINKHKEIFLNKVYTCNEVEYCEKFKNKYEHYAGRFAAKEAIIKAFSDKYSLEFNDIEVLNKENGKPYVNILKKVDNINQIDISISHCREYAIANAIVFFSE